MALVPFHTVDLVSSLGGVLRDFPSIARSPRLDILIDENQDQNGVSVEVMGQLVENVTPSSQGVDEEDIEQDIEEMLFKE
ncbi:hypothetical protein HAX54_038643 [Datura stramonium]|uniref:Uncharacterized protein n=1 Tax=Datura stramonium TaxID=4076 RepID=A0ABS8VLJ7_DATST|nr:hypothetical protein [Datura stramonium]